MKVSIVAACEADKPQKGSNIPGATLFQVTDRLAAKHSNWDQGEENQGVHQFDKQDQEYLNHSDIKQSNSFF